MNAGLPGQGFDIVGVRRIGLRYGLWVATFEMIGLCKHSSLRPYSSGLSVALTCPIDVDKESDVTAADPDEKLWLVVNLSLN